MSIHETEENPSAVRQQEDTELQAAAKKAQEVRWKLGELIPEIAKVQVQSDPAWEDTKQMIDAASQAVELTMKMLYGIEKHHRKQIKERGEKK